MWIIYSYEKHNSKFLEGHILVNIFYFWWSIEKFWICKNIHAFLMFNACFVWTWIVQKELGYCHAWLTQNVQKY